MLVYWTDKLLLKSVNWSLMSYIDLKGIHFWHYTCKWVKLFKTYTSSKCVESGIPVRHGLISD